MNPFKKILFPSDFSSCAASALPYVLNMARRHKAEVHVLHVVAHFDNALADIYPYQVSAEGSMPTDLFERIVANVEQEIQRTFTSADGGDLDLKPVCQQGGSPARAILNYISHHDIDLVVMGTHGHTGLSHLFLGSIAERVVRMAACPVLTVREQHSGKLSAEGAGILVATDFSEDAQTAIRFAQELATASERRLHVLHVVEPSPFPNIYYPEESVAVTDTTENARNVALEKLSDWIDAAGHFEQPVETHIAIGSPAREISGFAEANNIEQIVIAARGHGGLKEALIGGTAEMIVRFAPCPVWTVKSPATDSPKS